MSNRTGIVFYQDLKAGEIQETDDGFLFFYYPEYLDNADKVFEVSKTLPLRPQAYKNKVMFPFFDGLIPEGWLLYIAEKNWKIAERDRMGLLLACCKDCIGAVSVSPKEENE